MQFNMNGTDDSNYRYKLYHFKVIASGKGNGLYTVFDNIDVICKTLNHPEEIILKYIASVTGSNYISDKQILTGTHTSEDLKEVLLHYIKYLVMCPVCNIPETIPSIVGNKKNSNIKLTCFACKNISDVVIANKHISKGVELIIKYLKINKIWKINNLLQMNTLTSCEFHEENEDPFL